MELASLAGSAVDFFGQVAQDTASGVASGFVATLVRERMGQDPAVTQFSQDPGNAELREAAVRALHAVLAEDQEFAERLARAVQEASAAPQQVTLTNSGDGQAVNFAGQATLTASGRGKIFDNSRHTHKRSNKLVLLVGAAVIVAVGGTFGIIQALSSDEPSAEEQVRETATTYFEAFASGDVSQVCELSSYQARQGLDCETGQAKNAERDLKSDLGMDESPDGWARLKENLRPGKAELRSPSRAHIPIVAKQNGSTVMVLDLVKENDEWKVASARNQGT